MSEFNVRDVIYVPKKPPAVSDEMFWVLNELRRISAQLKLAQENFEELKVVVDELRTDLDTLLP